MSVVVDLDRVEANIHRFHAGAARHGLAVRAHVKAHRSPPIAARQVAAGAVGVAVHSAKEAELYATRGIDDIVIAWPWRDGWRAERFAALTGRCRLTVHVDTADILAGYRGTGVGIRLDVDTGLHRVGVAPENAVALARAVAATDGVRLDGVTGYRGVESADEVADREQVGRAQAMLLVEVAEAIRADGIPCPVVCAGGTATASGAATVPGVTELCSGVYATYDAGSADIGLCSIDDVAVSVTDPGVLAGCDQPWNPGVVSQVSGDRVLPAHVCPLAKVSASEEWPACVLPDRR
ncbi:MAG TPA: alanine racemase [Actinopolymorphaceae bacterium]